MERKIDMLSDAELDIVVGGVMNENSANLHNWQSDPSGDKLPWNPTFDPHGGPLGVHPKN
jgi:hypothetical protein